MRDLQQCRAEIDRLDRQIVALFEERMAVCREVGAYKVAHHLPVLDEERERQVLQAKAELLQDADLRPQVIALFETIMAGSRSLQRRMVTETDPAKAGDLEAYQAMRQWSGQPLTEQRVLYQGQPGPIARKLHGLFRRRLPADEPQDLGRRVPGRQGGLWRLRRGTH